MSNLCEMIRSMHVCSSGSNIPGAIAIQEQASLREGAVSQLSVICTSCQVCAHVKGEPELTDPFNLLINIKLRMI